MRPKGDAKMRWQVLFRYASKTGWQERCSLQVTATYYSSVGLSLAGLAWLGSPTCQRLNLKSELIEHLLRDATRHVTGAGIYLVKKVATKSNAALNEPTYQYRSPKTSAEFWHATYVP